ncbi:long-chain fatty acid--CoA ligase [Nannocystis bainbridge]|uniref:Long-chain fatty acid--CoA ligase n=1 Tax=Nannocystis bainbridge TaxID=2995303 RepID=A0ABT5EDP7_9BACT|nr:long-chain fatty acid--CoA ligase [Nannocystis bainbridge]MDC0723568.1 long-chain fatty acid--CoA ligase [Nannocystis bainbridge]
MRIGALVSLLEPGGPDLLGRRLEALAPRHIATDAFYRPLLGLFADLTLEPAASPPLFGAPSRWYRPGEPCAALFSPLRRPPHLPVPLRCDELYLGALRDGAMTFALRPGDRLAAPGFDALQHQPALLFAALLAGATYVHIEAEEALRDPRLLDAFPLRSLGLGARICEHLLGTRAIARPQWSHVFRNPEEPTDWESWRELIDALGLHETAMSNVVLEAAAGGSLLGSPRRPGKAHLGALMNLVPAAGRPWKLLDFTGSGQPAVGDVGVFAPLATIDADADTDPLDPHVVLGLRHGGEFLYGGATEPRRSGRVYPVDEVLAALDDCPFLHGASLVAVPAGGPTLAHRFVLLGFTGDEPIASFEALRTARIDELKRVLSTRLTPDFLPDAIELFPCFARLADGAVDHRWCQFQFHSGALHARVRTPVFQRLTALRGALGRA